MTHARVHRIYLLGLALAACAGCGPPPTGRTTEPLRVEINGKLPDGTRSLYAAFTLDPVYCARSPEDECSQIFQQSEIPVPDPLAFRLAIPEAIQKKWDSGWIQKLNLRVEARGDGGRLLARGAQFFARSDFSVQLNLAAPPVADLCTLHVALEGLWESKVEWGNDAQCPPSPAGANTRGIVCVAEVPIGVPVSLLATTTAGWLSFKGWDGTCAGMPGNVCTLPMNGPATVRARFQ